MQDGRVPWRESDKATSAYVRTDGRTARTRRRGRGERARHCAVRTTGEGTAAAAAALATYHASQSIDGDSRSTMIMYVRVCMYPALAAYATQHLSVYQSLLAVKLLVTYRRIYPGAGVCGTSSVPKKNVNLASRGAKQFKV